MIGELKAKYHEIAAKKRAELDAALEAGQVADPVSIAISVAVSVALSAASYLVATALAPKPPRQQQGKLSGTLQLMNSEQGIFIPEIYGAGPEVTLVTGSNPTWQNLTNTTAGADGSITKTGGSPTAYDAGASHNVAVAAGDAFIEVIAGTGPASVGFVTTASPTVDDDLLFGVQWHSEGTLQVNISGANHNIGRWVAGDKFRVEIRKGRFRLFKNSAELSRFPAPVPAVTYPLHFGIIMYASGSGVSNTKVQIADIGEPPNAGRGGVKVPAIIVWTSGIRKNVSVIQQPVRGGKGGGSRSQAVENITYDIDLRLNYANFGPHRLIREYGNADILIDQNSFSANPTGVHDPTIDPDDPYDPTAPPDPQPDYPTPIERVNADIAFDGDDVGTGTIQAGGSPFAFYPGNDSQQPDPIEEADIDGRYGAGSTPAHKNRSGVVHTRFDLSRTSGMVPNLTAALEHTELKTYGDIFASFCERVNVLAANDDHDFTGISNITVRGLLISGRLFKPAEIMDSPEIQLAGNFFVTEAEGQVTGYAEGDEPTLEIDDTEVGWLDGEADVPDIIPELESLLVSEISLPRQIDVKSIDPDDDWDATTAHAQRQVTEGVSTELLEIQIAQLAEERRATAQRALYRRHASNAGHKFTLPWTYLYIYPGYKITINRAEGFTHTLRLTSVSGGIGVLDCEGFALEPSVFNQPATGPNGTGSNSPQPIPAMTVMSLLDTPLLRDEDAGKVGMYVAGTPRTGFSQSWRGFGLVMFKNNEWIPKASSELPGTIGTVVSVTALSEDPDTIDLAGEIVVDLYGTTQTLSSVTEADIEGGANLALFGNMLGNFADAAQEAGFPNRWTLTTLLNGQKETGEFIADVAAGDRFVLIDEAVTFVPMDIEDLNIEMEYKAVTVGQSLDDAATILFTWLGGVIRDRKVTNLAAVRDGSGNWHVAAVGHPRELPAFYNLRIRRPSDDVVMRDIPIATGGTQAVVFGDTFGDIAVTNNNLATDSVTPFEVVGTRTTQEITGPGAFLEFVLPSLDTLPGGSLNLALFESDDTSWTDVSAWTAGVYTLRMVVTDVVTGEWAISFWDIGGEDAGEELLADFSVGLGPMKIRLTFSGTELRVYKDWANSSTVPLVVSKVPPADHFPMKAAFYLATGAVNSDAARIEQAVIGGMTEPSTIYSKAQQDHDDPVTDMASIDLEMWQVSTVEGRKVRQEFP